MSVREVVITQPFWLAFDAQADYFEGLRHQYPDAGARLEKLDTSLIEAALDLGATPARAFWRITLPLSLPGVYAGCLLVFVPAVGEFVIPELLGVYALMS